jgi:ELWxxDGT repeat protein
LYVSNGEAGSAVNLNLNPTGASNPTQFMVLGSSLYFVATDGATGAELWSITGSGLPVRLTDIEAGGGSSNVGSLTSFQGDLYFAASNSLVGQKMWKISGGVLSQYPTGAISSPSGMFEYNGLLYFTGGTANGQLYALDGTNPAFEVATLNAMSYAYPHYFAEAGGALYFLSNVAGPGSYDYELWTYSGAGVPTQLTMNLSDPNGYDSFSVYNDTLYFSAETTATGRELGHSTAGAAPAFFDINPGTAGSQPGGFTEWNGSLYFGATTAASGYELYSVTGTGAPALRAETAPGAVSGYPYAFAATSDRLYFASSADSNIWELWSFDGTTASQESALSSGSDPNVYNVTVAGNFVYFTGETPATGTELWRTAIVASAAAPGLAATGTEAIVPAGVAALLLLAGLALSLTRRRSNLIARVSG